MIPELMHFLLLVKIIVQPTNTAGIVTISSVFAETLETLV